MYKLTFLYSVASHNLFQKGDLPYFVKELNLDENGIQGRIT
jgi:hypothetical protein